jgi:hypothetical protein
MAVSRSIALRSARQHVQQRVGLLAFLVELRFHGLPHPRPDRYSTGSRGFPQFIQKVKQGNAHNGVE